MTETKADLVEQLGKLRKELDISENQQATLRRQNERLREHVKQLEARTGGEERVSKNEHYMWEAETEMKAKQDEES